MFKSSSECASLINFYICLSGIKAEMEWALVGNSLDLTCLLMAQLCTWWKFVSVSVLAMLSEKGYMQRMCDQWILQNPTSILTKKHILTQHFNVWKWNLLSQLEGWGPGLRPRPETELHWNSIWGETHHTTQMLQSRPQQSPTTRNSDHRGGRYSISC